MSGNNDPIFGPEPDDFDYGDDLMLDDAQLDALFAAAGNAEQAAAEFGELGSLVTNLKVALLDVPTVTPNAELAEFITVNDSDVEADLPPLDAVDVEVELADFDVDEMLRVLTAPDQVAGARSVRYGRGAWWGSLAAAAVALVLVISLIGIPAVREGSGFEGNRTPENGVATQPDRPAPAPEAPAAVDDAPSNDAVADPVVPEPVISESADIIDDQAPRGDVQVETTIVVDEAQAAETDVADDPVDGAEVQDPAPEPVVDEPAPAPARSSAPAPAPAPAAPAAETEEAEPEVFTYDRGVAASEPEASQPETQQPAAPAPAPAQPQPVVQQPAPVVEAPAPVVAAPVPAPVQEAVTVPAPVTQPAAPVAAPEPEPAPIVQEAPALTAAEPTPIPLPGIVSGGLSGDSAPGSAGDRGAGQSIGDTTASVTFGVESTDAP